MIAGSDGSARINVFKVDKSAHKRRSAIFTIFSAHKKYLIASLAPCVPDSGGLGVVIWGVSADPAEYARIDNSFALN